LFSLLPYLREDFFIEFPKLSFLLPTSNNNKIFTKFVIFIFSIYKTSFQIPYFKKCGFPLAEERKSGKRFSHAQLGVWVQECGGREVGVSVHMACVRLLFLFSHCAIA